MLIKYVIIYILLINSFLSQKLYRYYDYDEIIESFKELSQTCSQYIKIDTSQTRYNLPSIKNCGKNNNKSCLNLIVFLTDFDSYTLDRPSYYISSSIHGNEVIGASSLLEFAKYFCDTYDTKKSSLYHNILKTKLIIITPMTNAYGYSNKVREEKIYIKSSNKYSSVDPNRDFPYYNSNDDTKNCMRTLSARTINEIFNEFIIQGCLTFHGGDNVIGYPWGNYLHIIKNKNGVKSSEAPDYNALLNIGKIMLNSASSESNEKKGIQNYKLGDMTSTVYPLNGALEDWAYGGWEVYEKNKNGINPIKSCKPDSFDDYNMLWDNNNIAGNKYYDYKLRCLIYLIEASYKKMPNENEYGINEFDNKDIFDFYETKDFYGHVPRNMRLIYSGVDLISASVYIDIAKITKLNDDSNNNVKYKIPFLFMGCITLKKYSLHKIPFDHMTKELLDKSNFESILNSSTLLSESSNTDETLDCYYNNLTYYNITIIANKSNNKIRNLNKYNDPLHHFSRPGGEYDALSNSLGVKINNLYSKKGSIYVIKGESPDYDWSKQENPDPDVKPQSHVVRNKVNKNYYVKNGNYSLKSNYYFYSYPIIIFDNDADKKDNLYIIDDIDSFFYEDEFNIMKLILNYNDKKYKMDSQIRFNKINQDNILTSENIFDINLKIEIQSYKDKIIQQKKDININTYLLLSNNNEVYNLTDIKCNHHYGDKSLYIICNVLTNKNGVFIRQNLANSIIGFELISDFATFLSFYGIFSFENDYKGKYFVNYYNENNTFENNLMMCDSNFPYFINKSTDNNNNFLKDFDFQILISKLSNTKLNLKFNIQINNNKYNSYNFLILFPYCEEIIFIEENSMEKEIFIEENSEGKIIGKIIYIIPVDSKDYEEIKKSEKKLENKNNNILSLNIELTKLSKKSDFYEFIPCSIVSYNSFRNEISFKELNNTLDKLNININKDENNAILLLILGILISSFLIGIIIYFMIKKKFWSIFKYNIFHEEKMDKISNTSN